MSLIKDDDLNLFMSLEKRQFLISGLYPLNNQKWNLFYNLRCILLFFLSSCLVFPMLISLSIGVDNLSQVTDIMYYLSTQTAYLWKLSNFAMRRQQMLQLEQHLKHPIIYKYYNIMGIKDLKFAIKFCRITAILFRISVLLVVIFYAAFPIFDENSDKELPFAGWYPINTKKYRSYIYVFQIVCLTVSAFTNANLDIITAYYVSIGIALLKLIKSAMSEMDYACKSRKLRADKHLGDILFLHQHTIQFLIMIEEMFSYGVFVQFLASIAVICLTGFQMLVVSPASAQFLLLISYILCMMCQVAMYCWFGNEILFESSNFNTACYNSNWYEGTQEQKKVLLIIMERSKREIKLTAGKFFSLTLTTLVMILKSSYSYFAVLQRIYKDKNIE